MRELPRKRALLQRQVWTDYVARMVEQKGADRTVIGQDKSVKCYSLEQTRSWLTYLALQMRGHQQTIFYAEHIQSDWLTNTQQRTIMWLTIRVSAIVIGALVGILVFLFVVGPSSPLPLLPMGLLSGFVGGCLSQNASMRTTPVRCPLSTSKRVNLMICILLCVLIAASAGLGTDYYSLGAWARDGCILGLGSGLSFWIFRICLHYLPKQQVSVSSASPSLRGRVGAWFITPELPRRILSGDLGGVKMLRPQF